METESDYVRRAIAFGIQVWDILSEVCDDDQLHVIRLRMNGRSFDAIAKEMKERTGSAKWTSQRCRQCESRVDRLVGSRIVPPKRLKDRNATNTNDAGTAKDIAMNEKKDTAEHSGSSDCYADCYADRLVDLIDGHMPLDDDERATIRKYAIEVFGGTLDFFFGQMQMHSPKMNGQHSYRFQSSGWPMTHCKGPTAVDAVKAAIQEIARERNEVKP